MNPEDFDYFLPEELVANEPTEKRDSSRLLVLKRDSQKIEHRRFPDILGYLKKGDLIVFNDTKVIPARLIGKKITGGKVEVLLISKKEDHPTFPKEMKLYQCMAKPEKGIKKGTMVFFGDDFSATAVEKDKEGFWIFRLDCKDAKESIQRYGRIPLPPYIKREAKDIDKIRYQTVFARIEGAIAAPTAGLHFTEEIIERIKDKGVEIGYVTLHTGPATFLPLRVSDISLHKVPGEFFNIDRKAADAIKNAKREGRRVIAVGSTVTRTLETAFKDGFENPILAGRTDLLIHPPFDFKVIDALVTNFHLPRSTLIMLAAAFTGREFLLKAYKEAIEKRYRFFSYGDSTMVL